jgi:hypothetical protein
MISFKEFFESKEADDYRGEHRAPEMGEGSAPLWDLSKIYPDDIYSNMAVRYYGDGSPLDGLAISIMHQCKNKPNQPVTIYRAVPNLESQISKGDWVTTVKRYAEDHGRSALNGNYKVLSKKVYARDVFTDGNSVFEFGYDPQPK